MPGKVTPVETQRDEESAFAFDHCRDDGDARSRQQLAVLPSARQLDVELSSVVGDVVVVDPEI